MSITFTLPTSIKPLKIILYQPQIPQNTGNIVRSCSVTGTQLALIGPLGFSLADRWLKRAGLDYWEGIDFELIESDFVQYLESAPANVYFYSSKATKRYSDISYGPQDWLVFGSETTGLPEIIAQRWPHQLATIPMKPEARCLNLATSVGIVLFEACRQLDFTF